MAAVEGIGARMSKEMDRTELTVKESPELEGLSTEEKIAFLQLVRLGEDQGYVSLDDLMNVLPEPETTIATLERFYDGLIAAGIEFLDDDQLAARKLELGANDEPDAEEEDETEPAEISAMHAIDSGDTIGLYLSQVGRVPLLTRDEEVELAKRIERGRKMSSELARGGMNAKRRARVEALVEDGVAAREHLIMANSRLVISVAKKYVGRGVPLLDLIQEGHVGLMRAVKKFDYRRGHKFSTYATWWIRQAVTRLVADHGRTIRIPVHMGDRINRMLRSRHRLTQDLGRDPGREELAEHLGIEPAEVDYMLRVAQRPLSLEKPTEQDSDAVIGDFIEDEEAPAPEEITVQDILEERIQEVLETLPHREALVLRLRYGLENGKVHTLKEIGEKMGITRERVRQIEAQALRRLRHPGMRRELVDFVHT